MLLLLYYNHSSIAVWNNANARTHVGRSFCFCWSILARCKSTGVSFLLVGTPFVCGISSIVVRNKLIISSVYQAIWPMGRILLFDFFFIFEHSLTWSKVYDQDVLVLTDNWHQWLTFTSMLQLLVHMFVHCSKQDNNNKAWSQQLLLLLQSMMRMR